MKFLSHKNLIQNHNQAFINKSNVGYSRYIFQNSMRTPRNLKESNLESKNKFSILNNTFNNANSYYNTIYYKNNINNNLLNEKYDILSTKKSINYPVINLEFEFNLLKNKFNELNYSINSSKHKPKYIHKEYTFQKNLNKTENSLSLNHSKIYFNKKQKEEKNLKNSINNYLFINNKFKYSEPIYNKKNKKLTKNEKLYKFLNTLPKNKESDSYLNFDNELSDENDDELSELANQIIKSNELPNKGNKTRLIYNNEKNSNNKNKNISQINFNNFIRNKKSNYTINNVNSIFILNKKKINKNIKQTIPLKTINEKKYFSIEKLSIEINSKTNSKYYENKKIVTQETPTNLISIQKEKSKISIKNEKNQYINLVPANLFNINLISKIKKNEDTIDKDKKVKFDARILIISYNEKDKVPKLNIIDNKNQKVDFVPLNMKEYLDLLTSNKKLKPSIILKNNELKGVKDEKLALLKNKVKKLNINNSKSKKEIKIENIKNQKLTKLKIEKTINKNKSKIKKWDVK